MKPRIIDWICTPFFLIAFLANLIFVEVLFRLCRFLRIPYSYDLLYGFINKGTLLALRSFAGLKLTVQGKLPEKMELPLVVISNHQSMFDIPYLNVALAPLRLRFVAKIELAKGIPAISFALRHGGHALIDREQGASAVVEIEKMARNSLKDNFTITMFPEGTRSRDGKLRSFKQGGLEKMADTFEELEFLPVAISGAWEVNRFNFKPVVYGVNVKVTILPVVRVNKGDSVGDYCTKVRNSINEAITGVSP